LYPEEPYRTEECCVRIGNYSTDIPIKRSRAAGYFIPLPGLQPLGATQRYTSVDEAGLLEVWHRTHPRGCFSRSGD
jgi:hypothetical protein